MTTINATDPTSNAFNLYADPNSLTSDALLIYCQSQLSALDGDIKGYLDEQRLNVARKKGLADLENTMKKYTTSMDSAGAQDVEAAWNRAMNSLPPGDPVRNAMNAKYQEFLHHDHGYGPGAIYYSGEEWSALMGDVHSMLENVNGNAEINMIQLQSIMSKRQTAVQLTTSMLSKLDEGTKSVVSNIGR
jgi:hypothetical protein